MDYDVKSYKSIKGIVEMPILKPVRIKTTGLSRWKKFTTYFARRKWEVVEDYKLYVPWLDTTLLIPKGYVFDAASVPRLLWPLIDPTGVLLIGSIFHDFGYQYNCLIDENLVKIVIKEEDKRKFFDQQIRDINIFVNGYDFMNNSAYSALRGFGWLAWLNYRKKNIKVEDVFKINFPEQMYGEFQDLFEVLR